jgi:hypothetical protein
MIRVRRKEGTRKLMIRTREAKKTHEIGWFEREGKKTHQIEWFEREETENSPNLDNLSKREGKYAQLDDFEVQQNSPSSMIGARKMKQTNKPTNKEERNTAKWMNRVTKQVQTPHLVIRRWGNEHTHGIWWCEGEGKKTHTKSDDLSRKKRTQNKLDDSREKENIANWTIQGGEKRLQIWWFRARTKGEHIK